jgi:hypothetical protein
VIQEQVDARPGDQGHQALDQLVGLEEDRPRTVVPGTPQPKENLTKRRQFEGVLSDRRTQHVAAEVLEPLSVAGRHGNSRVEVKAIEVSLPLGDRGAPRRIRLPADAQGHLACTTARRDPADD